MVGPFLRKLWIFGKLDLTLLLRDKSSLVWLLAVPLLFTWVFGQAFQGGGGPSDVKVALTVVDQDGGVLARRLIRALESSGFAVEEPALETAEPAVGDPAPESTPIRTLTIPAGFTETVLSGTTVDISLSTVENANPAGNQAAQINSYKAVIRLLSILAEMDAIPAEAADPASATGEPFAELAAEYERRMAGELPADWAAKSAASALSRMTSPFALIVMLPDPVSSFRMTPPPLTSPRKCRFEIFPWTTTG